MKIHLKRGAKDHLTLCQTWQSDNWVLQEAAETLNANTICKICKIAAEQYPDKPEAGKNSREGEG